MNWREFADVLACPETRAPLEIVEAGGEARLVSAAGRAYRVERGVPILLTADDRARFDAILAKDGAEMAREYGAVPEETSDALDNADGNAAISATLNANAAQSSAKPFPTPHLPTRIIHEAYTRRGDATRILSVGGGPTRHSPRDINLNMAPFPNVDVVGNATRLPLLDNSVDGVWCNAVMEHVDDPALAAREMLRVTSSGGTIMVLVPFLHERHGYPHDYHRFTTDALAQHFRGADVLESGVAFGPSFAMWNLLGIYLNTVGQRTLPRWVRGLARRTLLPALRRSSERGDDVTGAPDEMGLAGGIYFCARKR